MLMKNSFCRNENQLLFVDPGQAKLPTQKKGYKRFLFFKPNHQIQPIQRRRFVVSADCSLPIAPVMSTFTQSAQTTCASARTAESRAIPPFRTAARDARAHPRAPSGHRTAARKVMQLTVIKEQMLFSSRSPMALGDEPSGAGGAARPVSHACNRQNSAHTHVSKKQQMNAWNRHRSRKVERG
jgi:hypothetical protein